MALQKHAGGVEERSQKLMPLVVADYDSRTVFDVRSAQDQQVIVSTKDERMGSSQRGRKHHGVLRAFLWELHKKWPPCLIA